MGSPNTEIGAFFSVSADTIERRFAGELAKGRAKGKTKLRQLQWQAAEKGNVTMQIWLGKQLLNQKDTPDPPPVVTTPDTNNVVLYEAEWGRSGEPSSGTNT